MSIFGPQKRGALGFGVGKITFESTNPPSNAQERGVFDGSRMESSLQKVAIWACVNLTATIAETMPGDIFSGEDKRPRPMPGWLADIGGDGYGLGDWLYQLVLCAMLRGNDVGRVLDRDSVTGKPRQIYLAHPDRVHTYRNPITGLVDWTINAGSVPASDIWHQRFYPVPGQLMGLSPVTQHALTIGTGIQAMQFGSDWFSDGAHPSSLLTTDQDLDSTKAKEAKRRFMASLRGREPAVLGNGWKWAQIQISPNESQFLETNGYTSAECCRIFGPAYAEIFGYETGGSLTYTNIEQRSLDLLTYAVDPWLVRIERAISWLLPAPQTFKFNRGALLRTDLLTRYKAHEIALRAQFKIVNEVRELEDMGPVPWGDEPVAVVPATKEGPEEPPIPPAIPTTAPK